MSPRCGATPVSATHTDFRVWAPRRKRVEVVVGAGEHSGSLSPEKNGFFQGRVEAPVGSRYVYRLDGKLERPDPASRFQPDGVHGPSEVVDPHGFAWTDAGWRGHARQDLVFYELHVGSFTDEGTFGAATRHLPELVDLGVTAIEVMPVAQTPGGWSWGYEGVNLFAVRNTYGGPQEFKAFVDACHAVGLSVVLDVVYNHLGPEGNYLSDFGPYMSRRHKTPWGGAFNFDGRQRQPVRQLIVDNALAWLQEYHVDGLRLDAIEFMLDTSDVSILDELRQAVTSYARGVDRNIHLIAETNVYDEPLLVSQEHRAAFEAIWCDCLMHSIYSVGCPSLQLTHRAYEGSADLVRALRRGYVFEGRASTARAVRNGGDSAPQNGRFLPGLVVALQTHDAVGNHPQGSRIHQVTSRSFQRAAAALVLLSPAIPLIFMGEEWSTDAPFPFFCDFGDAHLRRAVERGRARMFPQQTAAPVPSPCAESTFRSARWRRANRDPEMFDWYRRLLGLRKQGQREGWLAANHLGVEHHAEQQTFCMRFVDPHAGEVAVHARLHGAGRTDDIPTVRIPLQGEILLSSQPDVATDDGHVELHPNHAVVSRATVEPSRA